MKFLRHFKAPVRVLAVFLLFVLLFYILVTQTNLPEQLAAKIFEKMIGRHYSLTVTVGDIGGSIFSNLIIRDLSAEYLSGDSSFQIVSIKELHLNFSLSDLWRGHWVLQDFQADTLDIGLRREFLAQFEGDAEKQEQISPGPDFWLQDIELRQVSVRNYNLEKPELVSGLNLNASLKKSSDSITLVIDSAQLRADFMDFDVKELSGKYLYLDSKIHADSAYINLLDSRVLFSGDFMTGDMADYTAEIYSSHFDLKKIGGLFDTDLEGYFDISGNLDGNFRKINGQLEIDGSLFGNSLRRINTGVQYIDGQLYLSDLQGGAIGSALRGDAFFDFKSSPNEYLFSGRMNNFDLNTLVENTFKTSFSGEVIIDGSSFSESGFVLNLHANLDSGFFDVYHFDSVYGYAEVFLDSIVFDRPLTVEYGGAKAEAMGKIEYTGDIDISGHADFTDITPLIEIIRQKNIYGRGSGDFSFYGPLLNPHLTANFTSDSVMAYGFLSDSVLVDVALNGFALYPDGIMTILSGKFRYGDILGDSVFGRMIFDSNKIYVDTLRAYSPRINVDLALNIETSDSLSGINIPSMSLALDSFNIVNSDTIFFAVSDSSFQVKKLRLESDSGSLNVKGGYYYDNSLDFTLDCRHINLGPLSDYYFPEQQMRGIFEFEGNVGGRLENPEFNIRGGADQLYMYGYKYGDLYFDISYMDSLISIDSFYLQGDSNLTRIEGTVPFNLAFIPVKDRTLPYENIDLEVGSRGTTFFILPVILPDIEWIEGDNAVDLKVLGTIDNPEFSGRYYLRDGRMKIYYLENILTDIKADISFVNRYLVIDSMTAYSKNGSKRGVVRADGILTFENLLKPDMEINITAEDFPIKYDLGEIEAVIDKADLSVVGRDTITATGTVKLSSFLYSESFEPAIDAGAIQAADTASRLNYIIDISAPSNIKVENPDFNVELGGELRIFREGNFQNFYGSLETIRGKYNFLDQSFTILPEGEILFDDIAEFNPHLNIGLETSIIAQGEKQTAELLLSGTLQEPKLTATEGSEVSENQFFEWLTFQRFRNEGDSTTSFDQRLSYGAAEMALGRLSQFLGRRLGLGNVEFNPSFQGDITNLQQAQIRVGLYTTPGLYIYGTTQLDFSKANEVGFEYRFSRHWFLSGHRDEASLYHLNLNLNWDF